MFNKKKNRKINNFFLLFIILFSGLSAIFLKQSNRNIDLSFNDKNLNIDNISFTNITIVSDDITSWNDKRSYLPAMVVDNSGKIHVVWHDYTKGPWTDDDWDEEIMYASSLDGITWSNATVISDGYNGVYWNDGNCDGPDIAVDNSGTIHVVWVDDTRGYWGGGPYDNEILYVSSPDGVTWSNATVISDGYNGVYWNDGDSCFPDIAVDNSGTIHVVWVDDTKGYWGNDTEI
ncbi:MAG: exo-alpha-sialidase, partial [Candidatus Lokiarchaeota archaeon]|nr:exo-alpha-sialidase [Candidatus Lokiarchaeota archaeon]